MTIGPAPMIMMDLMSVRFGMIVTRFDESVLKACKNAIGIGQDLVIPEAEGAVALGFEPLGARLVSFRIERVLTAVDFDDQLRGGAKEIDNVGTDRRLAPE